MIASFIGLIASVLLLTSPGAGEGKITGRVVNASTGEQPVGAAEVVLRVKTDGEFVAVTSVTADAEGRFVFDGLPLDQGLIYQPGVSKDEIHYPGPRLLLSAGQPFANVLLKVHDTISDTNPLVIKKWSLLIEPEPGAIRVTESLLIENPEPRTYIGQTPEGGTEPITLRLAISPDFESVTFREEFYGRQFSLINGKLVTGIPWTPGVREVQYSYVLRNDGKRRVWTRPVDLPCQNIRLSVQSNHPKHLASNLGLAVIGDDGVATFESAGPNLKPGFTIQVELDRLPVSPMAQARWVVLVLMILAIAGTGFALRRRGRAEAAGSQMESFVPPRPRRRAIVRNREGARQKLSARIIRPLARPTKKGVPDVSRVRLLD